MTHLCTLLFWKGSNFAMARLQEMGTMIGCDNLQGINFQF